MKNMLSIMLLAIMVCCWSCSGGEDVPAPTPTPEANKVEISTSAPVVEQKGGTATVSFTTNAAWTASVSASTSWLSVSPASGSAGTHTLTITTTENDTYDERNASITIKAGNASKNITVTQKQKDALIVTSNKMEIGAEGGEFTIEAKTNISLTYEIEEAAKEWISAGESRALTTKTLKFNAKANEKDEPRQGIITLKGGDGLTETVTIYQEGEKPALVITSNDVIVGSDGETIKIELKSNVNYTMVLPDVDWISQAESRAISAYTHYLNIAPNESYDQRSAMVYVNNETEGLKDSISITQLQLDAIIVAKNEYEIDSEGGQLEFSVNTNVDFEISTSADWIKQNTGSRGLVEKALSFTIEENEAKESRSGEIIITYGELKQTIKVNQQGAPDYEAIERAALIEFYQATDGNNWKNNTNWCSDKPIEEWYGITFNGNLYELNLSDNNLKGYIPNEIGNLKDLNKLTLSYNKLEGKIPETIWSLPSLTTLKLNANLLTGSIPTAIVKAQKLECLNLKNNHLTGEIPDAICDLENLKELCIGNLGDPNLPIYQYNLFTGAIPQQIGKLTNLRCLELETCGLTGIIPESFYDLKKLQTFNAQNANPIKELTDQASPYRNHISGTISEDISALKNLVSFQIGENNITGNIPKGFAILNNLKILLLYKNRMSGIIPEEITSSSMWNTTGWNPDSWILPQQEGYGFTLSFYESTDYSKDGQVKVLQTATKGNGINVVLMGDGYSDTSINNGTYDQVMSLTMEKLFTIEPYKSFREMFNVYSVTAVSKNEGYEAGMETAFSIKFSSDGRNALNVANSTGASYQYAQKAIDDVNEAVMIIVMNYTGNVRSKCLMFPINNSGDYGSGPSHAFCVRGDNDDEFERILHHEAWGHGFAKLADEYVEFNRAPSADEIKIAQKNMSGGWSKNIDFTNDLSQIKWKHFINDSRYADEKLGAYEGASTYAKDIWRPTENSMMRGNNAPFNAPSREAIYYRIHKLAYGDDWEYDYEEFVKYDEINRNAASRTAVKPLTEAEMQEYIKNHCPPTIIKGTWRDAMKGKGKVVVPLR